MRNTVSGIVGLTAILAVALAPIQAQTGKIEVHWLGQAATKITTATGKAIVIDPFLAKVFPINPGDKLNF